MPVSACTFSLRAPTVSSSPNGTATLVPNAACRLAGSATTARRVGSEGSVPNWSIPPLSMPTSTSCRSASSAERGPSDDRRTGSHSSPSVAPATGGGRKASAAASIGSPIAASTLRRTVATVSAGPMANVSSAGEGDAIGWGTRKGGAGRPFNSLMRSHAVSSSVPSSTALSSMVAVARCPPAPSMCSAHRWRRTDSSWRSHARTRCKLDAHAQPHALSARMSSRTTEALA